MVNGHVTNFPNGIIPVGPECRSGSGPPRNQCDNPNLVLAILRMHRALCMSHVNGRNAYTHTILSARSFRAVATLCRNRHAFLPNDKRILFPHGTDLISQRSCRGRGISWSWKTHSRSKEFVEAPDNEEDAARAAILDKVMKGRQPTDLMLRCEFLANRM